MTRIVVLLCGPPGAGKSTAARESGLEVFDRDDAEWSSEKQFTTRVGQLARDPHARAVVIRRGATASARAKAARLVGATHVYVLAGDRAELEERVRRRGRAGKVGELVGVRRWFEEFDRTDQVPDFPGWPAVLDGAGDLRVSEEW